MKVAIYSPYFDVIGGGEKYLFDMAACLHEKGYTVDLLTKDLSLKTLIAERFGERFAFLNLKSDWFDLSAVKRILHTRNYDLFIYQTDGSYFVSLAKKNLAVLHVPHETLLPPNNWLAKFKFSFWKPVYNSHFAKRYFQKKLPQKGCVLYPQAEDVQYNLLSKKKVILSVGRFFSHLHSKKQEVLIKAYLEGLKKYSLLGEYKLLLLGAFKEEDRSYLNYLKKLASKNTQIEIKTNVSYLELKRYYQEAEFYWHAAGYRETKPELMEHFGTTVVEAMMNAAVPLVYNAGGPKEIVLNGKTGFFFDRPFELVKKTVSLIQNPHLKKKMSIASVERARTKFGKEAFCQTLVDIISYA